jgi:hypothetical protein
MVSANDQALIMYALGEEDVAPVWKPEVRPAADACPRRFCFHFVGNGDRVARGLHSGLKHAMPVAAPLRGDHCGSSFGRCSRLRLGPGDKDWYEPHEPRLESAQLPWFFFIAKSGRVVAALKARYLLEARALWGSAD